MAKATRINWNKSTSSYTVSGYAPNGDKVTVRNVPVRTQAECVEMEIRNGFEPSFGERA